MHVKGFILEDEQGREFVMGCEQPDAQLGRTFLLRGWQRRRLIPLQYSEQETRHIMREALMALDDLFSTLLQRGQDRTVTALFSDKVPESQSLHLKATQRCKTRAKDEVATNRTPLSSIVPPIPTTVPPPISPLSNGDHTHARSLSV